MSSDDTEKPEDAAPPAKERADSAAAVVEERPAAEAPGDAVPEFSEVPPPLNDPLPVARLAPASMDDLPAYARSLLRIELPVSATLASTKKKVADVSSLGPGAIIQFDKSCEELLDLYVDGRLVAHGEAVKVGDKFGLKIKSIVLPEERFAPIR